MLLEEEERRREADRGPARVPAAYAHVHQEDLNMRVHGMPEPDEEELQRRHYEAADVRLEDLWRRLNAMQQEPLAPPPYRPPYHAVHRDVRDDTGDMQWMMEPGEYERLSRLTIYAPCISCPSTLLTPSS